MPPQPIEVVEVGPRDGLQNEHKALSPEIRARLCEGLASAGLSRVEAASFVNARRVPQMADAEKVFAGIERKPGVTYAGLVLNERGYERAVEAGVDEVRYAFPVTDGFAQRNQNTTVADAADLAETLVERARLDRVRASITFIVAFGCPFEGRVDPKVVLDLAGRVADQAPDEIILADTIGVDVPSQVRELVGEVSASGITTGCHFHNTRNTGFANALAAIESGATVLDAAVGGTEGVRSPPRRPRRSETSPRRISSISCTVWAMRRAWISRISWRSPRGWKSNSRRNCQDRCTKPASSSR
jgi:(R)-citramalyl-CoA lyase